MKSTAVVVVFLWFTSVALGRLCRTGGNCNRDECCSAETTPPQCRRRGVEGDDCFPAENLNFEEGRHLLMCPCAPGLTCGAAGVTHQGKAEMHYAPRCRASAEEDAGIEAFAAHDGDQQKISFGQ